jgi:hypothetical protein
MGKPKISYVNFIAVRNRFHSSADEFDIDLSVKVKHLLKDIAEKNFQFSSKGELGKKRIEYEFFEARADLINDPDSKEYKQVKLLLACVDSIKDREHKRSSEFSPVVKVEEDIPDVPFEACRTPLNYSLLINHQLLQIVNQLLC